MAFTLRPEGDIASFAKSWEQKVLGIKNSFSLPRRERIGCVSHCSENPSGADGGSGRMHGHQTQAETLLLCAHSRLCDHEDKTVTIY